MLYYRLCIYTSNCVLGGTSVFFILSVVFGLADDHLSLLGGVKLSHPTFFYGYIALFLQFAVLQTIGWLGSCRLSPKILRLYWILLLLLTICDVMAGVVWVCKLDEVKLSFQEALLQQFKEKYSVDPRYTSAWDTMQFHERCCGVHSPQDFSNIWSSRSIAPSGPLHSDDNQFLLPQSCCYFFNKRNDKTLHLEVTAAALLSALDTNIDSQTTSRVIHHPRRPKPQANLPQSAISGGSLHESMPSSGLNLVQPPHLQFPRRSWKKALSSTTTTAAPLFSSTHWICPSPLAEHQATLNGSEEEEEIGKYFHVNSHGCQIKLMGSMKDLIELMFKYFCIICFIKVCCLVILHYAIRETIIAKSLITGPTSHRSCRYHNPLPNPSLTEERKENVGEEFSGTAINSSSEEVDDRVCGRQYNLWLTNNGEGRKSEGATTTFSMGKEHRFNGQWMQACGRPPCNEPTTSQFSQHDQHYDPQQCKSEGTPNKNVPMKSKKIGPELLMGQPQDLSLPVDRKKNFEQQQPSIDSIDHVSASFHVDDEHEKKCNFWLCCAYTE